MRRIVLEFARNCPDATFASEPSIRMPWELGVGEWALKRVKEAARFFP